MEFVKINGVYIVTRITGSQDNILGVIFTQEKENKVKLIQWPIRKNEKIKTSAEEVLKQVSAGLKFKNEAFKTDYKLSHIYFVPSESPQYEVYTFLIGILIRHYHTGGEFKEV